MSSDNKVYGIDVSGLLTHAPVTRIQPPEMLAYVGLGESEELDPDNLAKAFIVGENARHLLETMDRVLSPGYTPAYARGSVDTATAPRQVVFKRAAGVRVGSVGQDWEQDITDKFKKLVKTLTGKPGTEIVEDAQDNGSGSILYRALETWKSEIIAAGDSVGNDEEAEALRTEFPDTVLNPLMEDIDARGPDMYRIFLEDPDNAASPSASAGVIEERLKYLFPFTETDPTGEDAPDVNLDEGLTKEELRDAKEQEHKSFANADRTSQTPYSVDQEGFPVNIHGERLKDIHGAPIVVNDDGFLADKDGNLVDEKGRLFSNVAPSPASAYTKDEKGFPVNVHGVRLTDTNGAPLSVNDDGELIDVDGNFVDDKGRIMASGHFSSKEEDEKARARHASFVRVAHALGASDKSEMTEEVFHEAARNRLTPDLTPEQYAKERAKLESEAIKRPERAEVLVHELANSLGENAASWDAKQTQTELYIEKGLQKSLGMISRAVKIFGHNHLPAEEAMNDMSMYLSDKGAMSAMMDDYRRQRHVRGADEGEKPHEYHATRNQAYVWLGIPHSDDKNFSEEARESLNSLSREVEEYVNKNSDAHDLAVESGKSFQPAGSIKIQVVSTPAISSSAPMRGAVIALVTEIDGKKLVEMSEKGVASKLKTAALGPTGLVNLLTAAQLLVTHYRQAAPGFRFTFPKDDVVSLLTKWLAVLVYEGKSVPGASEAVTVSISNAVPKSASQSTASELAFFEWVNSPSMKTPKLPVNEAGHDLSSELARSVDTAFARNAGLWYDAFSEYLTDETTHSRTREVGRTGEYIAQIISALPSIMASQMTTEEFPPKTTAELAELISEATGGSEKINTRRKVEEIVSGISKLGWEEIINDFARGDLTEVNKLVTELGNYLVSSKDSRLMKLGEPIVRDPGALSAYLVSHVIKPMYQQKKTTGQISSGLVNAIGDFFGKGHGFLHQRSDLPIGQLPEGSGDLPDKNLLYASVDLSTFGGKAGSLSLDVGRTYELVYAPEWAEDKPKKKPAKGDGREQAEQHTMKRGRLEGFLFAVKHNAHVVTEHARRVSMAEIPRFLEFATNRYINTKLRDKESSEASISGKLFTDEGSAEGILDTIIAENDAMSGGAKDLVGGEHNLSIYKYLRHKPYKVVRHVLRALEKHKSSALKKRIEEITESDKVRYKDPKLVSKTVYGDGFTTDQVKNKDQILTKAISALSGRLPSVEDIDLSKMASTKAVITAVMGSREVSEHFLENALNPETTLGIANTRVLARMTNRRIRTKGSMDDMEHMAWFDEAVRLVLGANADKLGSLLEKVDDPDAKLSLAGNPVAETVRKMLTEATKISREHGKLADLHKAWESAAESWDASGPKVKFSDMFRKSSEEALKTGGSSVSKAPGKDAKVGSLLELFSEIYDTADSSSEVDPTTGLHKTLADESTFKKYFSVVGPGSVAFTDEGKKATLKELFAYTNSLLAGGSPYQDGIVGHLTDLGKYSRFLGKEGASEVYLLRSDADLAAVGKFIESNDKAGEIGSVLRSLGGKSITLEMERLTSRKAKAKKLKEKGSDKVIGETDAYKKLLRTGLNDLFESYRDIAGSLKSFAGGSKNIIQAIDLAAESMSRDKKLDNPSAYFVSHINAGIKAIARAKLNQEMKAKAKAKEDKLEGVQDSKGKQTINYDDPKVVASTLTKHLVNGVLADDLPSSLLGGLVLSLSETLASGSLANHTLQEHRGSLTDFLKDPKISKVLKIAEGRALKRPRGC